MTRTPRRARAYLRLGMLAVAFLLPMTSLMVFGSVWLWQNGYLLYWAIAACVVTTLIFGIEWISFRRIEKSAPAVPKEITSEEELAPDPSWTPLEDEAWKDVRGISRTLDPASLDSFQAVFDLGQRTVETVARRFHPNVDDALLRFTAPEAMALVERVSAELGPFIRDQIPLGDQLTIGQIVKLYGWRSVVDYAEQAYDIWRIIRMLNPLSAATHEIREQFSKRMYEAGRDHLTRKLAERYVQEVGRAAIDLYSGRLRVSDKELESHVSSATRRDRDELAKQVAEPLRLLVAGQVNAGKSSLVNALSDQVQAAVDALPATPSFRAYELMREGVPAALIIDSPGFEGEAEQIEELVKVAADSDLIVWVVDAGRADREHDRTALNAIRKYFAENTNRRRPPMMMVMSHIDRLRPFQEWAPPYDLAKGEQPKAKTIRAAMEAAGNDLDFVLEDIVPACLDDTVGRYNIDAIWARIAALLPEAQRAQLVRRLGGAKGGFEWGRLLNQAINAGRVISRVVTR